MIKMDSEFDEESCELGARYLSDNEGLTIREFIEKHASSGLKQYVADLDEAYKQLKAEGCT